MTEAKPVRVLALDGGILMGVMPARILERIDAEILGPRTILEEFQFVAGTSTGSLIAAGLVNDLDPKSPAELRQLYQDKATTIFPRPSIWRRVSTFGGLRCPKFRADGLEQVLEEVLGDSRLKDAKTDLLVPSYDSVREAPLFFTKKKAVSWPDTHDWLLREICRASSAGPTFLPAFRVDRPDATPPRHFEFTDGGVFANNPAMCAIAELWKNDPRPEIQILSLGSGSHHYRDATNFEGAEPQPTMPKDGCNYAMSDIKHIVKMMMDGNANTVSFQAQLLLSEGKSRFRRIQPYLDRTTEDDALNSSEQALRSWIRAADAAFEFHRKDLEAFFAD
ncbi:MAG: patatin-like phospholipase family protein [Planctomycetota bacterium]